MNAILTAVLLTLLSALAQPALAQNPAATVEVHEFTVTGNTLLPASSLQAALAPFKGRRSLTELKQAAQAVQDLYARAGYGGVVAYLPEQAGPAGSATIAVLEGRISQVTVSGNKQFSEANIRRSLPLLAEGQTPQVLRIDAQIQQANENPAKQVAVSLEPGKSQGEVNVSINVQELPASRWTLNADNTGNERTGRWRSTLGYSNAALWDLDHSLNLQFQTAPEKLDAVRVFSAGYRIPLYDWGASLDLFAAYSNVDGGSSSTVAGPLQFSGKGRVLGLRLTEYLARQGEIDQRLIIGLDQRAYLNSCAIAGLPDGACGTAGESVTVQPLTVEFTAQRGGERPAGLNIALLHNLGLGGRYGQVRNFEAVRIGARQRYSAMRMGLFATLPLSDGWQLQARVNGQVSDDALVPGEQFGLGGANSLRGYEERELLGDSGMQGALELVAPEWGIAAGPPGSALRWLAFVDAGHVRNNLDMPCRETQTACTLASVGLGLQLGAGPLQLRLSIARALRDAARTQRGQGRGHVWLSYSFI